ncbi:MAG TPA: pirin family protein [Rhodanobacteraceae bacterium]|nr:pirin family protein [Rhodanobacteraceae bacterium]
MPLERTETRNAEVGDGLIVRRALPSKTRRMVGAWCFLDHLGPVAYPAGGGLNVGPHPHIGLQTFTWMIEGEVVHRDSLGNEQTIAPGQVNLMTAGAGISHSEDSPPGRGGRAHAVQLWIALDAAHRHGSPAFRNYPTLPVIERDGCSITLLVGALDGRQSPVEVFSPLLGVDVALQRATTLAVPLDPAFEHAVLVLEGEVSIAGESFAPGVFGYLGSGRSNVSLQCAAPARVVLIGGAPFGEEILLWWNFVARTQQEMADAVHDWNHGTRFGEVHGSPSRRLLAPDVTQLKLRPPAR